MDKTFQAAKVAASRERLVARNHGLARKALERVFEDYSGFTMETEDWAGTGDSDVCVTVTNHTGHTCHLYLTMEDDDREPGVFIYTAEDVVEPVSETVVLRLMYFDAMRQVERLEDAGKALAKDNMWLVGDIHLRRDELDTVIAELSQFKVETREMRSRLLIERAELQAEVERLRGLCAEARSMIEADEILIVGNLLDGERALLEELRAAERGGSA